MQNPPFPKAVRKAVPLICAVCGPSGSGKTLSSLLFAAGLAGPGGWVRLLDTENERGLFYADDPLIQAAFPQGFEHRDLPSPWTPERYIEQIDDAEKAGVNVLVIDSGSHEWEGPGGCADIAEKDKGRWNNAKRRHKRFVYRLVYSSMHVIVCLRAREKSKIVPKEESPTGKEIVQSLGVLPICEKGFMYEMLVSLKLDESTHNIVPVKVPAPLRAIFREGQLLSKKHGELLRDWNNTGITESPMERLRKRARAAASEGSEEYLRFFESLGEKAKRALIDEGTHQDCKDMAAEADAEEAKRRAAEEAAETYDRRPVGEQPDGTLKVA